MTNSAMENSMFFFRYDPSISINGPSKNHGELIKGGAPDNQRVLQVIAESSSNGLVEGSIYRKHRETP